MSQQEKKFLEFFKLKRIIWPVLLGLGVTGWMLFDGFEKEAYLKISWGYAAFLWLFIAILLQIIRDFAYMMRIRLLTGNKLSWKKSFQVIMLWEFASSVTPSIVGGSAIALYILAKEKIPAGRSTAIVLIASFLDEMFYLIMVPIVIVFVGFDTIFSFSNSSNHFLGLEMGFQGLFIIGYVFILILNFIIFYGVFFRPESLKKILISIFKIRFLKKWQTQVTKVGDDLITTSVEMRGKSIIFWLKAFFTTFLSWTARFWMVNCLILMVGGKGDQLLIYARQLVMWVIMLISPTPGGSGIAEYIFNGFLSSVIPFGLGAAIAITWRLLSYYPYLIIGLIILPIWLRRVFNVKEKAKKQ